MELQARASSLDTGAFKRATTSPAQPTSSAHPRAKGKRGGILRWAKQVSEEDSSSLSSDGEPGRRDLLRSYSEPPQVRPTQLTVLDSMDTAVLFTAEPQKAAAPPSSNVNILLCVVSLVLGCLLPALVDLSRTATARGPHGEIVRQLPYTPLSVLRAESTFNVLLGVVAIALQPSLGGFSTIWRPDLHRMMLPLTLVYCLGDVAALCAIGSGGGPLYMAVANSRLLFAAGLSQVFLGRRQSARQWVLLAEITLATGVYAAMSSGGGKADERGDEHRRLAMVGICWAVVKSALSGTAAVLTESRYKNLNLWHANTLLKAQSLAFSLVCSALSHAAVEEVPLCDASGTHGGDSWCVDRRGWDGWTWAVLVSEICAGWLSVAVLTRMSAIAKFICKSATAPSLYLAYCAFGFGGMKFSTKRFSAVLMIAAGIFAYTMEPHLDRVKRTIGKCCWVREYSRV